MRNLLPDLKQLGYDGDKSLNSSGTIDASVLFVDISGFTNMTRKLMSKGKDGAEVLSEFMNTIFTPLIEAVYFNGGFIINFAGDAFTAVFKDDNGIKAASAASSIRQFFIENPVLCHTDQSFKISAKSGISSGELKWITAKAMEIEHFLFFGDVVDKAAEAEHCCTGNDICVGKTVYDALKDDADFKVVGESFFVERIKSESEEIRNRFLPDADDLRKFIPSTVLDQRIAGEFREVVSLFVSYKMPDNIEDIGKALSYLATLVQKYGGYISGFDFGDKGATMLALFGAPVSYEDNLERAVNCITDIRKNFGYEMRSGITEGVVYAGFTGSEMRSAYTALGDNVNLSARVMMKAPFGSDWIAEKAVLRARQTFDLSSVGNFRFKGMDDDIEVFEIKGRLKKEDSASFSTGFTGRSAELLMLLENADVCLKNGKLCVYSIYGEAGIGKSRLIYEIKKRIPESFKVLHLSTDTILRQSMNMFNSFFQRFFNQSENASPEENRQNFEKIWEYVSARIDSRKIEFEAARPYVGALAGIFWKGSVYDILDAKSRYENTIFAVADFFAAMAETVPLMIVLDDMHAVDSDSLEVVKALMKRLSDLPVSVYILSRLNDDGSKPVIITQQNDNFKEMVIDRLLESDVPDFIRNILGKEGSAELSGFVYSRSEGNPFFMEQLVLFMNERGYIRQTESGFSLNKVDIEVPGEVNSLLVSRLDRLSLKLKDLVFRASVLGNDIDLVVLSEIAEENEISDVLKEGIDELIWNEASKIIYSFRHALLRDAAYSMQLNARLKDIHKKVAVAIESNYLNEERFFSALAFHFEKAEEIEKEKHYLKKAADYSKSQYHNTDAEKMYEKLLGLLKEDEELIETGHLLGSVYKISGKWDLAEKIFRESLEIAKKKESGILTASSMKELAYMLLEKGRYDEAQPLLDSAVELYQKLGEVKGEGDVEGYRGLIHYYKGELDDAIEHFTKKLELAEKIDDKVAKALSYRYLGGVSYYRSNYKTALEYYSSQLAISKETENMLDIAVAENNLGLVYSHLNDFNNAAIFYRNALDTYKKIGIRQYICYTSNNLGELKFWLGEYDEAKKLFEDQLVIATELGIKRHVSIAYNCLGNICRKQDSFEQAEDYYNKAISIGEELNVQTILCEYYYEKASLFFEMKRFDESLDLAEKAVKMSTEVNRQDFRFRSELLKWRIVSISEPQSAIENIQRMIVENIKEENLAELEFLLFILTKDEKHYEKALSLFEALYKLAPKAAYKERIESLLSEK